MVCSVCSARRRVLLVRRSLQKQENKNGTHRLTTDASRFLFYPVFPRILNNSWQVLPLRPQCFWAILLSQYRRRTGSGPCTRGRRLRPPKGDFVTKYLFQFARILAFCFLGEILHAVLPLPIPASVYGLILLLLALRFGIVKLEQVKEVGCSSRASSRCSSFPPRPVSWSSGQRWATCCCLSSLLSCPSRCWCWPLPAAPPRL